MAFTINKITPASIVALKEALANIYWTKQDLRNFLTLTINHNLIVNTIDWNKTKFDCVAEIIDRMVNRDDLYREDLINLFKQVYEFNDFSHLRKWDESDKKIAKAKQGVEAVRLHAKGYFDHIEEVKRMEERKREAQQKVKENINTKGKLEEIKSRFYEIALSTNAQKRGFELEKILNELFQLHDLDPKASFKIMGEQIDGAFTFDGNDYLLEAKWQKELVNAGDLYKFAGKLEGKLKNTLGLFFSMDGFSEEALQVKSNVRAMILMDGQDLNAILENRIKLDEMLYRKRRYASETGNIFLKLNKLFSM